MAEIAPQGKCTWAKVVADCPELQILSDLIVRAAPIAGSPEEMQSYLASVRLLLRRMLNSQPNGIVARAAIIERLELRWLQRLFDAERARVLEREVPRG